MSYIDKLYRKYPDRDWEEDSLYENGNYECICHDCFMPFIGHKRRNRCKKCETAVKSIKENK